MNELATINTSLSASDVHEQIQLIQQVMKDAMKEGTHYGEIPGTGGKPTLLKPGAEKLLLTFRLGADYRHKVYYDVDHMTVETKCILFHIESGNKVGTGAGMCSTKESKYAWRNGERVCPECKKSTIIKGKEEYGGGFICFAKKGGCGAKFKDSDTAITSQVQGKVPNPDIADTYNTVMKMADKRALVAATLNATAASDIFTQDLEETVVDTATGEIKTEVKQAETSIYEEMNKPAPTPHDMAVKQITALEKELIDSKRLKSSQLSPLRKKYTGVADISVAPIAQLAAYKDVLVKQQANA